jgi:hypothetical protein
VVDVVTSYVEMDLSQYADDESLITYFVNPDARASVPRGLLALTPRPDARQSREWSSSIRFPVGDPASEDIDAAMTGVRQMLGLPDIPIDIKAIGRWQYEGCAGGHRQRRADRHPGRRPAQRHCGRRGTHPNRVGRSSPHF